MIYVLLLLEGNLLKKMAVGLKCCIVFCNYLQLNSL